MKKKTPFFLAFCILAAYLPFLNFRVLRMAGDEKVYISQAIEMMRNGRWFVQTLAGEPSYFKGPLHYLFLRVGMLVFGNHLIAATWMNAFMALSAALAMYFLGRKYWGEKSGLLLGIATGLNVGVFSHALASQMEVELCAFYAFATAVLGLAPAFDKNKESHVKFDFLFWVVAGMVGWVKSPVHSALIGVSGVLFWSITGQLIPRLRSLKSWLALFSGIFICLAGYAPAFIADRQNFIDTFIIRENLAKPDTARSWSYVMKPLLYFSLPWTLIIFFGFFQLKKEKKQKHDVAQLKMLKLGAAITLPTVLFWASWKYKGQNYNLPVMAGMLTFAWACFKGELPRMRLALRVLGVVGVIAGLLMLAVILHFWPLPGWWGRGWLVLSFASIFTFSFIFIFARDSKILSLGAICFFLAFGSFVTPLGEREMVDIRHFMKDHPGMTYHYYDFDDSIWSEWGILQLTLNQPFYVMHKLSQFTEAMQPQHVLIVPHPEGLKTVLASAKALPQSTQATLQTTPWIRWLTKGRTADGQSRWKVAWEKRDLSQLEREFFIVWTR